MSFQCNATLAITGAIRGPFIEKIYEGLGLESLKMLVQKYKVLKSESTFLILYQRVIRKVKLEIQATFPIFL